MLKLFPPQEQVINNGLLDKNKHCFLNMATGSGKTYLAELAIEKIVKSGYKAIYVTPLRALASQQLDRWQKRFSQYRIGIFTGETIQKSSTKNGYSKAQILIMTPERLDACMRNWRTHWTWIPDVSLVVIDEFHILGQPGRGSRLEGTITRLIRLNPFLRVIGLSATLPNAEELSDWLCGASFSSKWRQVPLEKRVVRFKSAKEKPELLLTEISRCIARGGQSLVFCNSRSRVQALAAFLCNEGITAECHHAGLVQEKRKEIEKGFRDKTIKVLVATSTLEMGLNLPARQVIIYDSYAFSDAGFSPLPVWSFIQRAGRAGRPGLDDKGEVVLFLSRWAGKADKYLNENCEPVLSRLTDSRALQEQLLIDVFSGYSRSREELINGFLPLSFYKHQHEEANLNGTINKLILADLLHETHPDDDKDTKLLKVGLLGRLAVKLMFSPATVKLISDCYESFAKLYLFDLLLLAALSEDCSPVLQANYEELDTLCDIVRQRPSTLLDLSIEQVKKKVPDCPGTLRILAAIKMSAICVSLIKDEKTCEIAEKFDVFESDILMLKESMVRILMGETAIVSAIDKHTMGEEVARTHRQKCDSVANMTTILTNMLRYQIKSEYVALTKLNGVGGKTAKLLVSNGYTTLQSIAAATQEDLTSIKGIGKKLAEKIFLQTKQLISNGETAIYSEMPIDGIATRNIGQIQVDPYRMRRSMELFVIGNDNGNYLVTGSREDHIVRIIGKTFSCDCQDFEKHHDDCKHILCVKRTLGDSEILKMVKRIKEDKNHTVRESLQSLWYSVTRKESE